MSDYIVNVEKKEKPAETFFVFPLIKGLLTTFKHAFKKPYTIEYPKKASDKGERYRGLHRLKKDELGRPNCVACYMCATACPAECIHIEAEEAPWDDREKVCKEFVIDELRCIYCGYCEEACPCDAIELTDKIGIAAYNREEFIYDKDRLLWDK